MVYEVKFSDNNGIYELFDYYFFVELQQICKKICQIQPRSHKFHSDECAYNHIYGTCNSTRMLVSNREFISYKIEYKRYFNQSLY